MFGEIFDDLIRAFAGKYIYAAAFRDREAQALGAVADILNSGRDREKKNT